MTEFEKNEINNGTENAGETVKRDAAGETASDKTTGETVVDETVGVSSEARKLAARGGIPTGVDAGSGNAAAAKGFSLKDTWFYYKWHILIALFFVTVFTVLIVQSVTKDKYDLRVLYAGPAVLSDESRGAITEALAQQIDVDCNGDGVKNAELFDLILMNTEEMQAMYDKGVSDYFLNPSIIKDNQETLSVNSMAGQYVIFFIDADYYGTLRDNGVFIPLDEMGVTSGQRKDEYSVYLSSLDLAKFYTAFNVFPADTLVCVKRLSSTAKKKDAQLWEDNKRIFKLLTDFKLPEDFVPEK